MNLKKGISMKTKKIISIALAITMLLMTPTQAVFAEGQQEVTEDANIEMKSNDDSQKLETTENVPDVTLHDEKINNDTVEENQENEITQQTDKLNYVVVNKKYIEQGDEQQIVVSVGNGITVEAATLNYHRVSDGKTYQVEMTQSNEEALMFDISYVKNAETGEYQLDSLDYSVSGENRKIEFLEAGIDAKYGVNTEVKTDADAQISNPDSSSDNEIVEDVVSFDEEGNQISENSIEEAIAAQQADSTKSRAVASDAKTKNVVVVLDPGHDATHAGAIGVNGLREEVLTLKIARYCKEELQQYSGVTVYMTRESEACPNPGTSSTNDNAKRVAYAKSVGANVYVSIHMNSGASGAHGAEVYYPNSNYRSDIGAEGNKLASKVLEQLVALGLYNRGVKIENSGTGDTYADGSLADKFGVIRGSKNAGFPGIIIEHAFITNSSDAAFLSNENNLKRLGQADAAGIVNYFGLTKGTWIQDSTGWWFRNADGTYPANQWAYINGAWYHFNAAGYRENGWITLNGVRFYLEADGRMVTGWKQMEETWYYFDGSGAMRTGWLQLGSTWYWLDNDGKMVTGWKDFGEYWYYFGSSGNMYVGNCSVEGKRYQFCDTGYVVDCWIYQNGIWYYCNSDRTYAKGFKQIGGATYYFNDKEQMVTGWQNINDSWYYFEGSGVMKTGWLLLNNTWYWLENDGKMKTGWKSFGNVRYYFEQSGSMVTGVRTIDGQKYDFGADGVCKNVQSGWNLENEDWYYIIDGSPKKGWLLLGNTWYYLDSSTGIMRTGWVNVNNQWYYMDSNGAMLTGYQKIENQWYYFNKSLKDIPNGALGYTGVTPIMGTSTLGKDRVTVVQKIVSHYTASGKLYPSNALNGVGVLGGTGGAPNIVTFCEMIYDEAVFENVRPEILYAQIMLETGYLQYGGDVEINQFNFGGLGATGNGVKGNSFIDVRTGIKAQVQHLKAYASVEPLNATQVVDERFKYVTRNTAPYVEWLGIKENPTGKGWAADAGYGFNLMKIVNSF